MISISVYVFVSCQRILSTLPAVHSLWRLVLTLTSQRRLVTGAFTYMQCDVPASGNVGRTYAALHVQYRIYGARYDLLEWQLIYTVAGDSFDTW